MDKRPADFTKSLMMARHAPVKKKPSKHKGHTGGYRTEGVMHAHKGLHRGKGKTQGTTGKGGPKQKKVFGGMPGFFGSGNGRALD